jgi:TM2 domain-containing membrane protein YozV
MKHVVFVLLCVSTAFAQHNSGFADALMRQGDYFRAITEYKRTFFHTESDSLKNICLSRIAVAYRKSAKYESAIDYAATLLMRPNVPASLIQKANLTVGLSYLDSRMPHLAVPYFTAAAEFVEPTRFPLLCLGLAAAEMDDFEVAKGHFERAVDPQSDGARKKEYERFAAAITAYTARSGVSPTLAAAMSFVLPGSGQIYSGHSYDGIQAFLYTGSMAFATYGLYRYEHSVKGQLSLTYIAAAITALYHAANVIGAHQTARFRNARAHRDFTRALYDAVMKHEPD